LLPVVSADSLIRAVPGVRLPFAVHPPINGPENTCSYMANDNDMTKAGLTQKVQNYCAQIFGTQPDAVHVNQPDGYGYNMCLTPGKPLIDFNWVPVGEVSITGTSSFKNSGTYPVDHTFTLSGNYGEAVTVATTNSVDISADVEYGIDFIIDASLTFQGTYSFQHTLEKSSSYTLGFQNTDTATVPPSCTAYDKMVATMIQYGGYVTTNVCLDGYARCQFGNPVQGHYYWYIDVNEMGLSDSDKCWTQSGKITGSSAVNAKSEMTVEC